MARMMLAGMPYSIESSVASGVYFLIYLLVADWAMLLKLNSTQAKAKHHLLADQRLKKDIVAFLYVVVSITNGFDRCKITQLSPGRVLRIW